MALVGSYVALSRPLVAALPVFLLAWLRFCIGALAMPHWLKKPAFEPLLSPQTRRLLLLESFLGNFLFSVLMLYGVSMTSAVSAGVIMASIPAVVALMSFVFLRERIGARVWGGVACAAVGIGLFSLSKSKLLGHAAPALAGDLTLQTRWLGDLLVFGAVLCEANYAVIGKKLTGVLGARRITSIVNLLGLMLMTPFGLYAAIGFDFAVVPPGTWLLLLFYALAASVWTVWLWMTGLQQVPAAQAGVFTVLLPISAAATGVLALGETLSAVQLLAFGIALLGVLLATWPTRRFFCLR